jgi:hypothetical protein
MRVRFTRLIALILLLAANAVNLGAQVNTASLTGLVTDPSKSQTGGGWNGTRLRGLFLRRYSATN